MALMLSLHHCDLCGQDLPGFLWSVLEAPGTAGGHVVIVEGPITVEHDQPADYFIRNLMKIRISMDARPMLCRDVERSNDAGDPGDEGRDRGEPVDARSGGAATSGAEDSGAGPGGG